MKTWKSWRVYYWDYPVNSGINDCFGNSRTIHVTARNCEEALRKSKKLAGGIFRFNRAIYGDNGIFAEFDRLSLNSEQEARYC